VSREPCPRTTAREGRWRCWVVGGAIESEAGSLEALSGRPQRQTPRQNRRCAASPGARLPPTRRSAQPRQTACRSGAGRRRYRVGGWFIGGAVWPSAAANAPAKSSLCCIACRQASTHSSKRPAEANCLSLRCRAPQQQPPVGPAVVGLTAAVAVDLLGDSLPALGEHQVREPVQVPVVHHQLRVRQRLAQRCRERRGRVDRHDLDPGPEQRRLQLQPPADAGTGPAGRQPEDAPKGGSGPGRGRSSSTGRCAAGRARPAANGPTGHASRRPRASAPQPAPRRSFRRP